MIKAWIDARHQMVNRVLWGLTLLERNLKELSHAGIEEVVITTTKDLDPGRHFCFRLPKSLKVIFIYVGRNDDLKNIISKLPETDQKILVLEGHTLCDRRILNELLASKSTCAVALPGAGHGAAIGLLSQPEMKLFASAATTPLTSVIRDSAASGKIRQLDLKDFTNYIENLRSEIEPFLLLIKNEELLKKADLLLRQTVHKGVLEFVAKYIHPPFEFGAVRLLSKTPVTPNQVTILGLVLSGIAAYFFATGQLLAGIILAVIKGVLDGVDGKLARLLLKFSKIGDRLDHVGDAIFDGIWYLSLGWHFSQGDPSSTGGQFALVLFFSYLIHKTVPGIFRNLHKKEIYVYEKLDVFCRLIGARMNNNIWALMIGIIAGRATEAFYFVSLWMFVTGVWFIVRLTWVTLRSKVGTNKIVSA